MTGQHLSNDPRRSFDENENRPTGFFSLFFVFVIYSCSFSLFLFLLFRFFFLFEPPKSIAGFCSPPTEASSHHRFQDFSIHFIKRRWRRTDTPNQRNRIKFIVAKGMEQQRRGCERGRILLERIGRDFIIPQVSSSSCGNRPLTETSLFVGCSFWFLSIFNFQRPFGDANGLMESSTDCISALMVFFIFIFLTVLFVVVVVFYDYDDFFSYFLFVFFVCFFFNWAKPEKERTAPYRLMEDARSERRRALRPRGGRPLGQSESSAVLECRPISVSLRPPRRGTPPTADNGLVPSFLLFFSTGFLLFLPSFFSFTVRNQHSSRRRWSAWLLLGFTEFD